MKKSYRDLVHFLFFDTLGIIHIVHEKINTKHNKNDLNDNTKIVIIIRCIVSTHINYVYNTKRRRR